MSKIRCWETYYYYVTYFDYRSHSFLHLLTCLTEMRSPPTYIALENVIGFEMVRAPILSVCMRVQVCMYESVVISTYSDDNILVYVCMYS